MSDHTAAETAFLGIVYGQGVDAATADAWLDNVRPLLESAVTSSGSVDVDKVTAAARRARHAHRSAAVQAELDRRFGTDRPKPARGDAGGRGEALSRFGADR